MTEDRLFVSAQIFARLYSTRKGRIDLLTKIPLICHSSSLHYGRSLRTPRRTPRGELRVAIARYAVQPGSSIQELIQSLSLQGWKGCSLKMYDRNPRSTLRIQPLGVPIVWRRINIVENLNWFEVWQTQLRCRILRGSVISLVLSHINFRTASTVRI